MLFFSTFQVHGFLLPGLAVKPKLVNTKIWRPHFTAHTVSKSAILYLKNFFFEKISCYFFLISGTRVFVARVGRQTKTREYKDLEAHFTAHLGYSHHQKAVILDAPIDHQPSYCDSTAGEDRLKPG